MFESVETQLDTGLPGLLSACLDLESLRRLHASTQLYQHFRVGPASGCPLPYTVYFLELQLVTSRVTLATKQLLCLHSQRPRGLSEPLSSLGLLGPKPAVSSPSWGLNCRHK